MSIIQEKKRNSMTGSRTHLLQYPSQTLYPVSHDEKTEDWVLWLIVNNLCRLFNAKAILLDER